MVTWSPGLMKPGLTPLRMSDVGVLASKLHFSTLPPASVASRKNHECGFSRRTCVTTPRTVIGALASNSAAKEWCATARPAPKAARNSATTPGIARRLCVMREVILQVGLRGNRHPPPTAERPIGHLQPRRGLFSLEFGAPHEAEDAADGRRVESVRDDPVGRL